jgi:trimethylamine-N-oxide reductase (cytochrome c)
MTGHDEWYGDGFCHDSLEQQFVRHQYPIEGEVKMFYRYGG